MLHLYATPLSSPANKVRFCANYLSIPYEVHYLNLSAGEHKKPEMLAINPCGKIPFINDEGFYLAESNAIIRYLADKRQSSLYPRELQQRALVDQWIDYASQHVAMATSKILFNTLFYKLKNVSKDERSFQEGHEFLKQYLPVVEQQLAKHTFIAGANFTLADISMLAALDACETVEVDLSSYAHISEWREKLMKEAFYQDCHVSFAATLDKFMKKINKA